MKKILVTGGTGFIGSHLCEFLIKKGHRVIAFDKYNINNNYGWLENSKFKKELEIVLGDIRDYDLTFKIMKNVDTVFHLAALIGIPYSYISPLAYIKTNIEGTYNILEASKFYDIKNLIVTSTSETYGNAIYTPIDENHRLIGQSPYSASKISADQIALSYYLSYNIPVKIIRPFNCYGPRQSARAIIPTIISQINSKRKNVFLGNVNTIRDLTYVSDLCEAYYSVYKSKKFIGQITNVGTNRGWSVKQIYEKISKLTNNNKKLVIDKNRIRPKNSEVTKLICNNQKLTKLSSWRPKIVIDQGLQLTLNWFDTNKEFIKADIYNV